MRERIELLGLPMDTVATKQAGDQTKEYLDQESSAVIYFVNSETLLLLKNEAQWKDVVSESELILPGTVNVNASINEALGEKRDPFFLESYLDTVLDYVIERGYETLLVTEREEQFVSVQEHFHEKRPMLTLSGLYRTQAEESIEYFVNEINSVAPDLLILALDEKEQMELLCTYRSQMNAGLMVFTGGILYNRAVNDADVPEKIQKLKIDPLYKWFRMDGRVKAFFNNLRMKIHMKIDQDEDM